MKTHNIFVPNVATAKSTLESFFKNDKVNVNVFVIAADDAKNILEELKTINGGYTMIAPVTHIEDKNEYIDVKKKSTKTMTSEARRELNAQRAKYITQLAGQVFSHVRENIKISVKILEDGKFLRLNDNVEYEAVSPAFENGWRGKIKGKPEFNGYKSAKNENGRTIDDEIDLLADKDKK